MTTVRRFVGWAEREEEVRAAFLVGSRGERGRDPDALSDHDVLVFVEDPAKYESDERWLSSFGSVLVMLEDEYELLDTPVPTRLVQYRDGSRIDVSICAVALLERMARETKLPPMLDAGYRVVVDKDGWSSRLPEPTGEGYGSPVPTESSYRSVVREFWWEVAYVAKHLARGEVLPARYSSECVIRFQCLVPMLEWYARGVGGSCVRMGPHGRGLIEALDTEEWKRLERTCPGASIEEGWKALSAATEFFRDVSRSVADHFGFEVQDEIADGVEALLRDIRERLAGEAENAEHVASGWRRKE